MSENVKLVILDKFRCLGEKCPDSCCTTWQVDVDSNVLECWKGLPSEDQQQYLANTEVVTVKELGKSVEKHLMVITDKGVCGLVDNEGLCSIQVKHGHKYLPDICQSYPRSALVSYGGTISTALLSCPEVVYSVLFSTENNTLFPSLKKIAQNSLTSINPTDQLCGELGCYMLEVLATKKYYLKYRLYLLSNSLINLYNGLERLSEGEDWSHLLKEFHSRPKDQLFEINSRSKSGQFSTSTEEFIAYWQVIYTISKSLNTLVLTDTIRNSRVLACLDNKSTEAETFKILGNAISSAQTVFSGKYSTVMERYVLVGLINRGYPFSPAQDNQLMTFAGAIISFSIISLFVACVVQEKGSISEQELAEIIWRIERVTSHSAIIHDLIRDHPQFLEIQDYNNMILSLF